MANNKKKKKGKRPPSPDGFRSNWIVPLPTPGDEVNEPERNTNEHIFDLLVPFVARDMRKDPSMLDGIPTTMEGANMVGTKAMAAYVEKINGLRDDYMARLAAGYESHARKDFQDANVIDILPVANDEALNAVSEHVKKYIQDMAKNGGQLYAYVPCFESGVLRTAFNQHIAFQVERLDLDAMSMTLDLTAYEPERTTGRHVKIANGTVEIIIREENKITYRWHDDAQDGAGTLSRVPPSKLPWSRDDKLLWERVVIQNEVDQAARRLHRHTHDIVATAETFIFGIALSNYLLSRHRPVAAKEQNGAPVTEESPVARELERTKASGHAEDAPREPAKRIVHDVGPIRIISAETPKRPSRRTVRNYVTASWTVRGFMRKTKLGKTVYVRPSVRRRKNFAGQDAGPAPVEIRFSGETPQEDPVDIEQKGKKDGKLELVP